MRNFIAKLLEAALPMTTSNSAIRGHLRNALMKAHGVTDIYNSNGPWVSDYFPGSNQVVYDLENQTYRRSYTITYGAAGQDPTVTLGEPKKCHVAYMDSKEADTIKVMAEATKESVTITHDLSIVEVLESSDSIMCFSSEEFASVKEAKASTKIPVKIIGPGWGSSAYYSKEVLKRDGPKVFKKGTHMMWNHATNAEEAERPEGDLTNLAAVLVEDAQYKESGPKGPGLYSTAKVFSDYSQQVAEKGPHIGVSINAGIKCHEGEAEGKTGRIADQFVYAFSTDFVTRAGAGGAPIVPALESERRSPVKENMNMTEQEIKDLQDKQKVLEADNIRIKAENAKLMEGQNVSLAVAAVATVLKEAGIEYNEKVLSLTCAIPVMKEGKPDPEWVKNVAAAFSDGVKGKVTGLGRSKESTEVQTAEATKKSLESSLAILGVPANGLKVAVEGRA